jgi:hypothetical protein
LHDEPGEGGYEEEGSEAAWGRCGIEASEELSEEGDEWSATGGGETTPPHPTKGGQGVDPNPAQGVQPHPTRGGAPVAAAAAS